MDNNFKSIDFSNMNFPLENFTFKPPEIKMPEFDFNIEETAMFQQLKKIEALQNQHLEVLKSIEKNTASIESLVELMRSNNENQEVISELLDDMKALASAQNKDEADNWYKKIITKASNMISDVETMQKIIAWGSTLYTVLTPYLQNGG